MKRVKAALRLRVTAWLLLATMVNSLWLLLGVGAAWAATTFGMDGSGVNAVTSSTYAPAGNLYGTTQVVPGTVYHVVYGTPVMFTGSDGPVNIFPQNSTSAVNTVENTVGSDVYVPTTALTPGQTYSAFPQNTMAQANAVPVPFQVYDAGLGFNFQTMTGPPEAGQPFVFSVTNEVYSASAGVVQPTAFPSQATSINLQLIDSAGNPVPFAVYSTKGSTLQSATIGQQVGSVGPSQTVGIGTSVPTAVSALSVPTAFSGWLVGDYTVGGSVYGYGISPRTVSSASSVGGGGGSTTPTGASLNVPTLTAGQTVTVTGTVYGAATNVVSSGIQVTTTNGQITGLQTSTTNAGFSFSYTPVTFGPSTIQVLYNGTSLDQQVVPVNVYTANVPTVSTPVTIAITNGGGSQSVGGEQVTFNNIPTALGNVTSTVLSTVEENALLTPADMPTTTLGNVLPVSVVVSFTVQNTASDSNLAVNLSIGYNASAVPAGDNVGLFYMNSSTPNWTLYPGSGTSSLNGTLTVTVSHLSKWTVMAYAPQTSTTPTCTSGCGGGGGFFTTTSTSTPGSAVVSSTGTTAVTTSDGNVTLSIPQGALPSGTTVQVTTLPTSEVTAPPASEVFAGDVIQISDGGVGLSSPVPATFKYNASALNGLSPLRLAVFYWNPTVSVWQYVGGAVNTSTGTITATLHHFSTYAVMANTQTFTDIPSGFWGRNDIDALLGAQIINGFPNGTFQPNGTVTRAQFAKMLVMALGITPATTSSPFTDVSSSAWYAPYVDAAAQAGVVNGVGNGLFDPNATISRQEMVTMIARAIGGTASSSRLSAFTDSGTIASWAQGAVAVALKDNLVKGMTSTTFDPSGTSTRAQAAAVIARTLRFNGTM